MYAHSCLIDEPIDANKRSLDNAQCVLWVGWKNKKNAAGVLCDCVFVHVGVSSFVLGKQESRHNGRDKLLS